MRKEYLNCSCGGGADVIIEDGMTTAMTECACGKLLLWAAVPEKTLPPDWDPNPPTLGISVSDHAKVDDVFN